uniref:Uncharacterized protein n=1 Tax=Oryza brachyantha TaxID=4533 RepID=J3L0T1_ORYBR
MAAATDTGKELPLSAWHTSASTDNNLTVMTRAVRLSSPFPHGESATCGLPPVSLVPPSWPLPELKRPTKESAHEPRASDIDSGIPAQGTLPKPVGTAILTNTEVVPSKPEAMAPLASASVTTLMTSPVSAPADSATAELTGTLVIGTAAPTPPTPPPLPAGSELVKPLPAVTAMTDEGSLSVPTPIEHVTGLPLVDKVVGGSPKGRVGCVVATMSPMATVMVRSSTSSQSKQPSTSATPMQITWVKEGRTNSIRLDASEDQCVIARLEDFIDRSVQIVKLCSPASRWQTFGRFWYLNELPQCASYSLRTSLWSLERAKAIENKQQDEIAALRVDQVSHLERMKGDEEGQYWPASRVLEASGIHMVDLEVECSMLKALNTVFESECSKPKKNKDATTAELVGKLPWPDSFMILRYIESLAPSSSLASIDNVIRRLGEVPAQHGTELRETTNIGVSHALAIIKSLYPRVDLKAVVDGFAADYDEEATLKLVNKAQLATESVMDYMGL